MRDDFKYKALKNKIDNMGVSEFEYRILESSDPEVYFKYKYKDFTFYQNLYSFEGGEVDECELLNQMIFHLELFDKNKSIEDDYFYFIHFQLIGRVVFDVGCRVAFLGVYLEILNKETFEKYPKMQDFCRNIETLDVSSLIENSEKHS